MLFKKLLNRYFLLYFKCQTRGGDSDRSALVEKIRHSPRLKMVKVVVFFILFVYTRVFAKVLIQEREYIFLPQIILYYFNYIDPWWAPGLGNRSQTDRRQVDKRGPTKHFPEPEVEIEGFPMADGPLKYYDKGPL